VRLAVVEALKADPLVSSIVAGRVYVGVNERGGISRSLTGEAFTIDGDLLPSIVVKLGPRTPHERRTRDTAWAIQYLELWVYAETYEPIYRAIAAAKPVLDFTTSLEAVEDRVAWTETRWDGEPQGEQLDPNLTPARPVVMTRYAATVRELPPA
jgi:hypothetical protein